MVSSKGMLAENTRQRLHDIGFGSNDFLKMILNIQVTKETTDELDFIKI